jgi:hypothetical protein
VIKNIIGAVVGAQLAKKTDKVDNGTGAIIGTVAPALIARLSLPAMIAVGAGGYLFKRYRDQQQRAATPSAAPTAPATATTPVT